MDASSKRVIVAGGSGFIGRALCAALGASGWRVQVLTRGPARPAAAGGPEFVTWDGLTAHGWGHLADGAGALVNLTGENVAAGPWTTKRRRAILESRVNAGRAMVQAVEHVARNSGALPRVLVQASAVGYYGDSRDPAVDESHPSGGGFLAEVCRQWEAASAQVEALGVRRAVIRSALVLGEKGGILAKMLPQFKFFAGGPLGDGSQGFPWIHIEDEVRAIMFLMEREDASGPFNLASPQTASNLEFCRALGAALSRPCWLPAPAPLLRLVFGEMADDVFLAGCRAVPARLLELGFTFTHPDLARALSELAG
ncbi:TIGR01777 family oxidoreductase [Fundidesulfovibrio soli]|uniref:TIGR01777 family oxidoreductase n=1 Tax=Fundidesulfovibrio soli TaxID=2922716 RepID=UPI001FAEC93A|nr:TIGR01777 family oxidoreductase [Fundidesulfovibrio soli]